MISFPFPVMAIASVYPDIIGVRFIKKPGNANNGWPERVQNIAQEIAGRIRKEYASNFCLLCQNMIKHKIAIGPQIRRNDPFIRGSNPRGVKRIASPLAEVFEKFSLLAWSPGNVIRYVISAKISG
jgi:hypothetical protein